jgi:hypothetical protein
MLPQKQWLSTCVLASACSTFNNLPWMSDNLALQRQLEEMFCCFLPAFQESTSLKELHMGFPRRDGPSSLALEHMSTHTQSLLSLSLSCYRCTARRYSCGCTPVWIEKEHHSTRAHTESFSGYNDCLNQFDQSSSPPTAILTWV